MTSQKQDFDVCPRCHKKGSLQEKEISNGHGGWFWYWYFEHYVERIGKTTKIRWCYVGKNPMKDIPNPIAEPRPRHRQGQQKSR